MKTRATVYRNKAQELGFSLLSTIMLMVLLAILCLGMLSLSTVSLRGSQAAKAQEEAKANARLALMLAIGQLQKNAGPDQRVTARAEIQDSVSGASTLQQPWLTGVWKTESNPRSDSLGRDLRLKRTQKMPAYLISGNERYDLSGIDPASGAYPSGYLTPAQSLPTEAVDVGRCSWAGKDQSVKAPLVTVDAGKASKGGYAYWVEDEGVKARLDLRHSFDNPADKTESFAGGALGHRNRIDWITKGGASDQPGQTLVSFPKTGDDPLFSKLISMDTVAFAGSDPKASRDDLHRLRSDLTTSSRSLLVDMQRGGFRRDLTAAFRLSNLSSLVSRTNGVFDTELIFPQQGTPNDGDTGMQLCQRPGGVPWSVLKDYAGYASWVSSKSQVLKVRNWLGNEPVLNVKPTFNWRDLNAVSQFAPVLNRAQLFFDVSYENVGGGNYDVMFHIFPVIVLWNPYDQPMQLPPKFGIKLGPNRNAGTNPTSLAYDYQLQGATMVNPPTPQTVIFSPVSFYNTQSIVIPAGKSILLTTPRQHVPFDANNPNGQELVSEWQDGFGLYQKVATIKFTNPAVTPRIKVIKKTLKDQYGITNEFYGNQTRIYSNELGFYVEGLDWNIDDAPAGLNFFTPEIRQPGAPLTYNSPKWGGVMTRKMIENQLQPLVQTQTQNANTYPAKNLAYNLRAHHTSFAGPATATPPQMITGTLSNASQVATYAKPQLANVSSSGPHYAFVGGSDMVGSDHCIMFHIPRDSEPMLSLAQFSHATLGRPYDDNAHRGKNIGEDLDPTYPIGNSLRPPHHEATQLRTLTNSARISSPYYEGDWSIPSQGANAQYIYRADTSFLYNNALWDTYYLSGYEPGKEKFLNARLHWNSSDAAAKAAMNDPLKGLSHLWLDGGFNVNSTSKAAWKALLASTVGIRDSGAGTADKPGYNRFAQSNTTFRAIDSNMTALSPDTYTNDARMLDEASLDRLAGQIVEQVKLRGPFPTLSAFVNRSVDPASHQRAGLTEAQVCNAGALQAALDGPNAQSDVNQEISRYRDSLACKSGWVDAGDMSSSNNLYKNGIVGRVYTDAAEGARAFGAPSYLMPSDILAKIGPFLTVRSDTFKVFAYGESRDASGKLLARVRCEAIVQRDPQWIGNRIAPTDVPQVGSVEDRFGRVLRVVSFRWLTNEDV